MSKLIRILVGKKLTRGLGAGGYPETGKKAAELARGTLEEVLKDVDLVFITAGLGGVQEQVLLLWLQEVQRNREQLS